MEQKRQELIDGLRAMATNAADGSAAGLGIMLDRAADRIENDGHDLSQYASKESHNYWTGGCLFCMFLISAALNLVLIGVLCFK